MAVEGAERYNAQDNSVAFRNLWYFFPENNLKGASNQEPLQRIKYHTELMPIRRLATV